VTFETELAERLRRAGDAMPVDVPPLDPAIKRGRKRAALRRTTAAASALLVATGLAWGLAELAALGKHETTNPAGHGFDTRDVRRFPVPYGLAGFVPLPQDWHATSSAPAMHAVLGLAASTDPRAVKGLVEGSPTGLRYGFHGIRPELLGPRDAFMEVDITYMVCLSCEKSPPLPRDLVPSQFRLSGVRLGTAIRELRGRASDGGEYIVEYWIGPDASARTRQAALFLLRHLNLPVP